MVQLQNAAPEANKPIYSNVEPTIVKRKGKRKNDGHGMYYVH